MDYQTLLLALDIWREASNQTFAAMVGVGWIVKNRAAHPRWWGTTIVEVITHKWQFSGMTAPGDPNLIRWPQENDPTPETDPSWANAIKAAEQVINGGLPDPTSGATSFYGPPLTSPPPAWGHVVITVKIDEMTFCK